MGMWPFALHFLKAVEAEAIKVREQLAETMKQGQGQGRQELF